MVIGRKPRKFVKSEGKDKVESLICLKGYFCSEEILYAKEITTKTFISKE